MNLADPKAIKAIHILRNKEVKKNVYDIEYYPIFAFSLSSNSYGTTNSPNPFPNSIPF